MSVLPQLDPDETLPRTNPGSELDSYQQSPAAEHAPHTDPRQQASPSSWPATRPDSAQSPLKPVRMRQMSSDPAETQIAMRQFKSLQLQKNMNTIKVPAENAWPSQEEGQALQETPVQPYTYTTQQTPFEGFAPARPIAPSTGPQAPYNQAQPSNSMAQAQPGYGEAMGSQVPIQKQSSPPPRTPTGSLRKRSGFLGIDEMPTTRLAAITVQARELANVVVQPQQAANLIVQGEAKKPSKKNWMSFVIRAVITLGIFFFLLKGMNWGSLIASIEHARKTYLLIGLFAGILCVFFSAWGWQAAVQAENIKADLSRLIALYLVGLGFSHFLPTSMGGDAVKAYYVGKDSGNMAGAASSALTSRITSFIGMLLVAIPALIPFYQYFTRNVVVEFLLLSVLLLTAIAGTLLVATFLPKMTRFLPAKLAKNKLVGKALEVGTAMTKAAKKPRAMLPAMFFGMMFWIASFINYYGYAAALDIKVPLPFYVIAIPFVSIITALPISIGGFGIREGTFVWLFTQIPLAGIQHVDQSAALALSLLMDAQVLFFGLIGGVIYLTMPKKEKIPAKA